MSWQVACKVENGKVEVTNTSGTLPDCTLIFSGHEDPNVFQVSSIYSSLKKTQNVRST